MDENKKIEFIKEVMKKYDIYSKILRWDKKLKEYDDIEWILSKMFAGYINEELVLVGTVKKSYKYDDGSNVILSLINNPLYKKDEEFELEMLKQILEYSKNIFNAKCAYIDSLNPICENIGFIQSKTKNGLVYKKEID